MFDTLYQRWVDDQLQHPDYQPSTTVDDFWSDVVDSQLDYLYQTNRSIQDIQDGELICSLYTRDEFQFLVDYFKDYQPSPSTTEVPDDFWIHINVWIL